MNATLLVERAQTLKSKPKHDQLGFGKYMTDHMFVMDYTTPLGWHNPRITPYEPITLDPAAKILHYGQTVFEGMKAYRDSDGSIRLFRPERNFKRLNQSSDRVGIPPIDEAFALEALITLLEIEKDWIPAEPETSLYIRPFIFATEGVLGTAASRSYQMMIILSPVGSYYAEGIQPVRIYVESHYVRTVEGGTGTAKTAGNYAAALKAQEEAHAQGYSQVLWLDGIHRKYIEEVGSMNVFFRIGDRVVTPELSGSILEGITRDSVIQLLKHWNIPVEETKISIDELYALHQEGQLIEAFGTGTAAVISPIGEMYWNGVKMIIGEGKTGDLTNRIYTELTGLQRGETADPFGWSMTIEA